MTMIPCPKCEAQLIRDEDGMCPDCKATADAFRQKKKSALVRKLKATATLVAQMLAAFLPILKPIWEKSLA